MEFRLTLPGGAVIEYKREPMAAYKLYAIVWSICLSIVLPEFFSIWK